MPPGKEIAREHLRLWFSLFACFCYCCCCFLEQETACAISLLACEFHSSVQGGGWLEERDVIHFCF